MRGCLCVARVTLFHPRMSWRSIYFVHEREEEFDEFDAADRQLKKTNVLGNKLSTCNTEQIPTCVCPLLIQT